MRDPQQYKYSHIANIIIDAFYQVYNAIGYGFLEKVYQNALYIELQHAGIIVQAQAPVKVLYRGSVVGEYYPDLIVDQCVIVEIKAKRELVSEHEAQLLNYLRATGIEVGLLLNFGYKPEIRRKVCSRTDSDSTDGNQNVVR